MTERVRKRHLGVWVVLLVLVVAGVSVFLNREWLYDFYRGQAYQPSAEMVRIRSDLQLTEQGEFLFNAAQPVLENSEEFNSHCRSNGVEIAILGCYAAGNIYIYNIDSAELNGIRELTMAHELLHAKWARMSEEEQRNLVLPLTQTFEANRDLLESELGTYDVSQKQEELYVRAGTEVANLPETLEKHYAEVFRDQNAIVAYYNSYIDVFNALETELETLKAEMNEINTAVETKTKEYEQRVTQLNANVVSFNSCAGVAGCFKTEEEFTQRRSELIAEQEALEGLYNEINNLINTYNAKVEIYNADVLRGENLNNLINSNSKPKTIE